MVFVYQTIYMLSFSFNISVIMFCMFGGDFTASFVYNCIEQRNLLVTSERRQL